MSKFGRRRIYLMRHGHVDYFAPGLTDPRGVPLTQEGAAQAHAAGKALADTPLDLAVFSGLPRTRETAEIVLAENTQPPVLHAEPDFEELRSRLKKIFEVFATCDSRYRCGHRKHGAGWPRLIGRRSVTRPI